MNSPQLSNYLIHLLIIFTFFFLLMTVMTEWDEFITLDYKAIYDAMSKPAFIFDGNNNNHPYIQTPIHLNTSLKKLIP